MKHLDEIPTLLFRELRKSLEDTLKTICGHMEEKELCPGCYCSLVAEVARDMAKKYEEGANHATH